MRYITLILVSAMLSTPVLAEVIASGGEAKVNASASNSDDCAEGGTDTDEQGGLSEWSTVMSRNESCPGAVASSSVLFDAGPWGFQNTTSASAYDPSGTAAAGTEVDQLWTVDEDVCYCRGVDAMSQGDFSTVTVFWSGTGFQSSSGVVSDGTYGYSADILIVPFGAPGSGALEAYMSLAPADSPTLMKGTVRCDGSPIRSVDVVALESGTKDFLDSGRSGNDGCFLLSGVTGNAVLQFTDPSGQCAPLVVGPLLPPQTMLDVDMLPGGSGVVPAPDGQAGTAPLRLERLDATGDTIRFVWDVVTCTSFDYNVIAGSLGNVSTYGLTDAACSIGTVGSYDWNAVPAGDQFFLVVGTDGVTTESSWGVDSDGAERGGGASGLCGAAARI